MKTEFDPLDIGLFVVAIMSAFIMVGIGSFDLFGVNFSADVTTISGYGFSTAYVLSAASVVGVLVTNENTSLGDLRGDVEQLDTYYMTAVAITLGSLVLWIVSPSFVNFVQSQDLWGVLYVMIVATGTAVMGWIL